ncbi:MAG: hypothetical protein WBA59_03980 [Moheibacter sp.]
MIYLGNPHIGNKYTPDNWVIRVMYRVNSTNRSLTVETNAPGKNVINWGCPGWDDKYSEVDNPTTKDLTNGVDGNGTLSTLIEYPAGIYNNDFDTVVISGINTGVALYFVCKENDVIKELQILSTAQGFDASEIAKNHKLKRFIYAGANLNASMSLNDLSACEELEYLKFTGINNLVFDELESESLRYLGVSRGANPLSHTDVSFIETNLPNLEVLILDRYVESLDFLANMDVRVFSTASFGSSSSSWKLDIDLADVLKGQIHQFMIDRVNSISYSGGGIFPSTIEETDDYASSILIQLPASTVTSLSQIETSKLMMDFANQVTQVDIANPRIIRGRAWDNSYTDTSQPYFKNMTDVNNHLVNTLGITITNT